MWMIVHIYMYSSQDPELLSDKLTRQYKNLAEYMGDNKLVINNNKTHLLVMGSKKDEEARKMVYIDTGSVRITPVEKRSYL